MSRIALILRGFGAFWWDFIVGDDWRIAVGIVVALAATALVATTSVPAWWIMPMAVVLLLDLSLWGVVRRGSRGE
jgi:hypothetical protein